MRATTTKYLWCLFVAFFLFGNSAFGQGNEFHRIQLSYGISIEIPSHWTVLSQATRNNLGAAGAAVMSNSGIGDSGAQKDRLLAVNATPEPTGAMVRVSVTSPPDYSQADLAAATAADLKALDVEVQKMYKQLETAGGPKLIESQPIRIESVNGKLALILPYVRAGVNGPSPWQVTQYKIPVGNRMIELTLSQRQSDSIVWRPILERVKRSMLF
jgi:hypothetical protein